MKGHNEVEVVDSTAVGCSSSEGKCLVEEVVTVVWPVVVAVLEVELG